MTDSMGGFAFDNLPEQQNYIIRPEKDIDPLNGVTTFDLLMISKHILGTGTLDSPYKMIAADVNRSGTITTFDIVELRKLILYIDTAFQNNTSWRFIDADYVFPDSVNPFSHVFPETYAVNGLVQDVEKDFVAVKVGDVNSSARLQIPVSGSARQHPKTQLIELVDQSMVAGPKPTLFSSLPMILKLLRACKWH